MIILTPYLISDFFCLKKKKMLLGIFSSRFLHLSEKTSLLFFRRLPSALLSHAIFPSYQKRPFSFLTSNNQNGRKEILYNLATCRAFIG